MSSSSDKSRGPVLDEATFQKLLAAAYVLQEHHDQTQKPSAPAAKTENPDADSDTSILAQIVETQHEIQSGHLDLDGTTNLVMDRILRITGAQGAAIGILDKDKLVYRAARGILSGQIGKAVRPEASLSSSTIQHDLIVRCPDAGTDFRVNPEITKRLGIGSLISVPVLHNGKTGGALELAFAKVDAFHDQDVRTCQLMAGLVTETLTRTTEEEWRKGLAAERASMLEVLEKIKPQLARLANTPQAALTLSPSEPVTTEEERCQHCGAELSPGEVFCGACGTSRSSESRNDLQSKWATLWNLKKASDGAVSSTAEDSVVKPVGGSEFAAMPDGLGTSGNEIATQLGSSASSIPANVTESSTESQGLVPATPPQDRSSAAATELIAESAAIVPRKPAEGRVWLRSIAVSPPALQLRAFWQKSAPFLRAHRGDLALGASFVLFLVTIVWAISSDHPTTSADSGTAGATVNAPTKVRKRPAPPKLSVFEQFLVSTGLAEAPPPPSYSGNPNIPVWVDVHTALYYCPGADLYGKTPQGRIASQRDAQADQFEPASRRVCD